MAEPEKKKVSRRSPVDAIDAPTGHQVLRMIQVCKEKRKKKHEMLIKFAWVSALRLYALTNMKVGYLNIWDGTIKVPAELQKNPRKEDKKKKDRLIVINEPEVFNEIDEYIRKRNLEKEDYLFNHGDDRKKYSVRRIAYMIEEAGEWIGIKRLRPHLLRHSRAKYLLSKGYGTKFVQELLLHEDAATTLNQYSRFSIEELKEQGMAGPKLFGEKNDNGKKND